MTSAGTTSPHRKLRSSPAPRTPRRVSGPLRGREEARTASRQSPKVLRAPRSVTAAARGGFGARAAAFLSSLPDRALVDRLVRGRAWIPLLGVMLAGIVAMQVEVLKLGASIGRSIERGAALNTRNQTLRASVASLADDQRIEHAAADMGMVMAAPETIGFLSAHHDGDAARAIANVHAPNSASFMSLLSSNGAVVSASGAPMGTRST